MVTVDCMCSYRYQSSETSAWRIGLNYLWDCFDDSRRTQGAMFNIKENMALVLVRACNDSVNSRRLFLAVKIITFRALRLEHFGKTMPITWLLMPWPPMSPGHKQPWYWLCGINGQYDAIFMQLSIPSQCREKTENTLIYLMFSRNNYPQKVT